MSLILEALRKSEAERRRGDAPDLRTELPPVVRRGGIATPRWSRAWTIAALALFALALAWLAWVRSWAPDSVDTGSAAVAGARQADDREPASSSTPAHDTVIAADTGEARIAAPSPAATPSAPATSARASALADHTPPVAAAPDRPIPPPMIEVDTTTGAAPAAPRATAPAPPAGGEPLALADLTPDQRRALPPLKVSMHMWSADPARRFVILDGRRLSEGDRAGELVVDAIGRDDVLLAWNGMRLRLSLR